MAVTINASTSAGLQLSSDTSGEIQLQDNGTTNLTVKTDGKVGIGTTTPSTTLDVIGAVTGNLITGRATGGEGGELNLNNPNNDVIGMVVDVGPTENIGRIFSTYNNFQLRLGQLGGTGGNVQFFTAATERARIESTGRVGIGVTSPTANLHISAGVAAASGAPLKFTSGTLLTNDEAGAVEYDGTSMFMTPSLNFGRATVPLTVYTSGIGTSGASATAATTDYAMFPSTQDTITLPVGTYYVILAFRIYQTGSASTPVLNLNIRGPASGGAVGTFTWNGFETTNNGTDAQGKGAAGFNAAATNLGTVIQIGTAATNPKTWYISGAGILKVTTAGTIAPSYQWASALTSGTVTLYAQNYMLIQQLDTQSAAAFGPAGAGWG